MKERDAIHFLQQLAAPASNLLEIRTIVPDGGPVRSIFVRSVGDAIAAKLTKGATVSKTKVCKTD